MLYVSSSFSYVFCCFYMSCCISYQIQSYVKVWLTWCYYGIFLCNPDSSVVLEHTSINLSNHATIYLHSYTHINSMKLTGMYYAMSSWKVFYENTLRILSKKMKFGKRYFNNSSQGCDMNIFLKIHNLNLKQQIVAKTCSLEKLVCIYVVIIRRKDEGKRKLLWICFFMLIFSKKYWFQKTIKE